MLFKNNELAIFVGDLLNMARRHFCSRCGFLFPNELANFCQQCGMSRDECEVSLDRNEETKSNEEAAINTIVDFRGPSYIECLHKNPILKSPSYKTIFNPPLIKNREKDKVYGKLVLHTNWSIQHSNLKNNNKQIKKWRKERQDNGVLPHGTFNP